MSNKVLNIFTIDFPYGNGEPFLKNEIEVLAKSFEKIVVFPMNFKDTSIKCKLPDNIVIQHETIFDPYNRLHILSGNILLIANIFLMELIKTPFKKQYLLNFRKHFNVLLHRINAANKLASLFKSTSQKHLVYTYWFTQWTLIFSIVNYKQKNISLYTRIHGMDVYEDQHADKEFFFPFRYFQAKQIKKVIAISENGRDHILKVSPQFNDKVLVNRLGVLHHGLNPNNSEGEFVLVSCSSFQSYKRVHLIFEILKKIDLKIKWIHFGDSEERTFVEKTFNDIPSNVTIDFMGYVSNTSLMEFYRKNHVDLFINVSETEGIPVSIMEAMSFGIPCIATNVGGVSEIVNNTNGFLVEKHFNTDQVAEFIINYYKLDISNKNAFRDQALNTWRSFYDQETNCKDLITILKS
jgi:glycosyltransferase involved in cell wall biosynthesis